MYRLIVLYIMEIKLPIKNLHVSEKITMEDINKISEIAIDGDAHDLLVYKHLNESMRDETIFYGNAYCDNDENKLIMFNIEIDELEQFANAVLKKIEIIRRNYSEQIKYQTDMQNQV